MKKAIFIFALVLGFAFLITPSVQALQLPFKNFYSNASASGYEKFYNDSGTLYFLTYNGTNETTNRDHIPNVYYVIKYNGTFSQIVQQKMPSGPNGKNLTTAGRTMESLAVSDNFIFVEYFTGSVNQGLYKHTVDVFNKTTGTLINEGDIGYGTTTQCRQFSTGADYMNSPFVVMPDNSTLTTVVYQGNFIVGRFNQSKSINDCPSATAIGSSTQGETTTSAVNGSDFWVLSKGLSTTFKAFRSSNNGATFTTVGTFGSGGNTNGIRYGGIYRLYDDAVNQYFLTDGSGTGYNITQLWYSSNGGVTWGNPHNISIPYDANVLNEAGSNTAQVFAYGLFRMANGTIVIAEKNTNNLVTYQCNTNLSSCGTGSTYIPGVGGFSTDANGNMVVKMLSGNVYYGTYPDQFIDEQSPTWLSISTVPISPVIRNTTDALNVTFNITAVDNVAIDRVILSTSGANFTMLYEGNDLYTATTTLQCGSTQYFFFINDTSGNANMTEQTPYEIYCGFTVPLITLTQPFGLYNTTTPPLVFTAYNNETISDCKYTIDDILLVDIPSCFNQTLANISTTLAPVLAGTHQLTLYVNDSFNIANFSVSYFTIDLSYPAVTITSPTGTSGSATFTIGFTATDASGLNNNSCYYYTSYNATHVPIPNCLSTTGTAPGGTHTIYVFVMDLAGNGILVSSSFTIGNPPAVQGVSAGLVLLFPLIIAIAMLLLGLKFMLDALNGKGSFITALSFFIVGIIIIIIIFGLATAATSVTVI